MKTKSDIGLFTGFSVFSLSPVWGPGSSLVEGSDGLQLLANLFKSTFGPVVTTAAMQMTSFIRSVLSCNSFSKRRLKTAQLPPSPCREIGVHAVENSDSNQFHNHREYIIYRE
ncbi:hypothetical protein K435DRAFT_327592 [Dendrothele bispora CBS 962.96]|uniref:Uncharacterized protein n=1 Tax=Dendrothele bispora (strain CBS 962.96) TaxID=1314807 RepID=A0A4S8MW30_DENBC|nr:hypothetical protein K435DRAFT_327592 [Dendrothele bispora CBS 962.96]